MHGVAYCGYDRHVTRFKFRLLYATDASADELADWPSEVELLGAAFFFAAEVFLANVLLPAGLLGFLAIAELEVITVFFGVAAAFFCFADPPFWTVAMPAFPFGLMGRFTAFFATGVVGTCGLFVEPFGRPRRLPGSSTLVLPASKVRARCSCEIS